MDTIGRARNARINQAVKHATSFTDNLKLLAGFPAKERLDLKDTWYDARNSLEQLVQCFHEANAYNNAMGQPTDVATEEKGGPTAG